MKLRKLLLLAAMSSMLIACGGGEKDDPKPDPEPTPTPEPGPDPEPEPPVTEVTYYLAGSFNGWTAKDENYTLTADPANAKHFFYEGLELHEGDELKVTDSKGNWHPDGMGNNTVAEADGVYTVNLNLDQDPLISLQKTGDLPVPSWGQNVLDAAEAVLYGEPVPYFADVEGLGELQFARLSPEVEADKVFYDILEFVGGELEAPEEGQESPLQFVAALFAADGWEKLDGSNNENGWTYEKEIEVEGAKRYLIATFGAYDETAQAYAAAGTFVMNIWDRYFYSASTYTYLPLLEYVFDCEKDSLLLPEDALYEKTDIHEWDAYLEKYSAVPVFALDVTPAEFTTYKARFAAWTLVESQTGFEAYSPNDELDLTVTYNQQQEMATIVVRQGQAIEDPRVAPIAAAFGLNEHQFHEEDGEYWIKVPADTKKTPKENVEAFGALLMAATELGFSLRGEIQDITTAAAGRYVNAAADTFVEIYVFTNSNGVLTAQILIGDFKGVPNDIAVLAAGAYNIDESSLEYDEDYGYMYQQMLSEKPDDLQVAFQGYVDLLLAYDPEFQISGAAKVTANYIYATYYHENLSVTIYVGSTTTGKWMVEIDFNNDFVPPEESHFAEDVATALGVEFNWDSSAECYFINNAITLGSGETVQSYVLAQAELLTGAMDNLVQVATEGGSSYYQVTYVDENNEGYVEMVAYTNDGKTYRFQVAVYSFDQSIPFFVNATGAALGIKFAAGEQAGTYVAESHSYDGYSFSTYGAHILSNIYGASITSDVLGYKQTQAVTTDTDGSIYAVYTNEEQGIEIEIRGFSSNGKTAGYKFTITLLDE